ncbi:molecular chaperone GrpE [Catalinimonas alkaloidigena]|uniref:nucleotide exchange factor GrpE n=1 Tax=Catalinimonas alkaloidigena TaxID=1075417 RepID=UPI0024074D2F|nr:nucleotide exchange factor GrpE [Catalinimonas alkaloidigena]MDF9798487.1 molecular chaperone GrpE [Catalinimonas alkaloidigena]
MAHNESEENKQYTEVTAEESMKEQPNMEKDNTDSIQEEADKASDQNVEADDTTAQDDTIQKLEEEVSAAKDKYLRLYAEFENYRKRTSKERLDLVKTANEELILDLLTVVDDLERSLQIFENKEEVAPMYEGISLVSQKFHKVLTQKALKPMEVGPGSDFDSDFHEAVAQTPAPEDKLKGKIVDVVEKGYFLGEKVLRYAKVVIGQ